MRHVSTPIYLTLVALSSIGVIMACCFLGLNIRFRRHRFIKMSSPNMNNIIIVGCILCYLSIVLLGTDGSIASSSPVVFRYWCRARAWVLALGFTLAFGAMFGKTWRVHAIFTNIKLNKKVIKDYKLMLLVLVLVLVDVGILITWQVIDPFEKAEKKLSPEVYTDYEVIPKLEYCSSHHMEIWLGSIYAYKGLLLAFGCFLAWETRHVSIPALNDSKYIGLSVYNVVIMCTCGAAVTFVIKDQPTHSFVIIAVFIIFATTATLCLVFVPKIIQLRRDPKGEEKRIRATLRKPSPSVSLENDRFQQQVKVTTEENRRLRGFLEQKAKELEHLLEQLGEDGCGQDAHLRSASLSTKRSWSSGHRTCPPAKYPEPPATPTLN
ncbi:gamma-aminobutyric acid type B receptor subunit 2-like isoform X6 [Pomacea canaliculata]|uniref:gamma-aminobutyric acid type B receptor subunit 2-like isoform X6 n=1 Tax=Pomacea canaliculata TaxID=400727 RepID=UPI000D73ACB7|nr:gamma-aminobutyric acid type B receptor subunit 2-like isoform X6 [Pomacea canaliculata]